MSESLNRADSEPECFLTECNHTVYCNDRAPAADQRNVQAPLEQPRALSKGQPRRHTISRSLNVDGRLREEEVGYFMDIQMNTITQMLTFLTPARGRGSCRR